MVPDRKGNAHKLSGTIGSNSGSPHLPETQEKNISITENGQYNSSGIHKQSERNSIQRTSGPS